MALAETAFAGGFGMRIDLRKVPRSGVERNDLLLFSESQSRFVVTLDPSKKKAFESLLGDAVFGEIGMISDQGLFRITGLHGKIVIEADILRPQRVLAENAEVLNLALKESCSPSRLL